MTLTIIARTGLRCSQCSQAAQAELPPASVVEVADGGMTEGLCAYHAAYRVPAAELAKALQPTKRQKSRLYRAPSTQVSQYQEQRSA